MSESDQNSGESQTNIDTKSDVAKDGEKAVKDRGIENVVRAYNVPVDFTISKLEDLILSECPSVKLRQIISPSLWEEKLDVSWKIICANRKSYDALLAKEDIWLTRDKKDKQTHAITFVPGDALDIAHVPSKVDEQMLVNAYNNEMKRNVPKNEGLCD
ncbi:conserved hypothetical protein [Theileria equi strain WA]|uniref:Uncharacterized protein n=1 Tax=Theileria equi strain WA TaxID=1537102 RepID=L1LB98_THEEQ|nr:conserved hypothetical protein [Theileria equi strain WA]EKX72544.1 conserved hypothetical protein [Theileria equi strain WA]|eukprot:XP_004831996.1 conserved hypothetical protein [Theileria equi strain WA]